MRKSGWLTIASHHCAFDESRGFSATLWSSHGSAPADEPGDSRRMRAGEEHDDDLDEVVPQQRAASSRGCA